MTDAYEKSNPPQPNETAYRFCTAFFHDPSGDIRENYRDLLSLWGEEANAADHFFAGYHTAMRAAGMFCGDEFGTSNIHERAIWAMRELLILGLDREERNSRLKPVACNIVEQRIFQEACLLLTHMQVNPDVAKAFLTEALPDTDIDTDVDGITIRYYDRQNPTEVYDSPHPDGFSAEDCQRLQKVGYICATLDDDFCTIIRSDDKVMMHALAAWLNIDP